MHRLALVVVIIGAACASHSTTTTTTTVKNPQTTTTTTIKTVDDKTTRKTTTRPTPTACPAESPNIGHPCPREGLSCNYGVLYVCNAGMWEARFSK